MDKKTVMARKKQKKKRLFSLKSEIYFDNSATTFPKPEEVITAMVNFMKFIGANPGRSGHRLSKEAGETVFLAREAIADIAGIKNPMRVIFGSNATDCLNLAIKGMVNQGDHVITTSMEHNSTIRPLKELEAANIISLTVLECDKKGQINIGSLKNSFTDKTALTVINHASNVTGSIQPVREIGRICKGHNVPLLVDGAQTFCVIPVNMKEDMIDLLAFAGHKGPLGPQGTGGLIMADDFDTKRLKPLKQGGTGSRSESLYQPDFIPDKYESGTPNTVGLAGLLEGVKVIKKKGIENISAHKEKLSKIFINGIKDSENIRIYTHEASPTGLVSINIKNLMPSDFASILDEEYSIMVRPGLHCSPSAHMTSGTFPEGTVRFSFGIFNTEEEIIYAIDVIKEILGKNI